MDQLPRWLVLKKAGYGAGQRLQKWRKFEKPAPPPSTARWLLGPAHYQARQAELQAKIENHDKYRFFAIYVDPTTNSGEYSVCRACGHVCYTEDERRAHLRLQGCAKTLVKAYEYLLRDMKCVICDCKTSQKKWGVPLHFGCERNWQEDSPTPSGLELALMWSEAQG